MLRASMSLKNCSASRQCDCQNNELTQQNCGDRCKHTPPYRQKQIIEDLIAEELRKGNFIGLKSLKNQRLLRHNTTLTRKNDRRRLFGTDLQPVRLTFDIDREPIAQETPVKLMNIISAKWWLKWCDYTQFDSDVGSIQPQPAHM